MPDNTLEAQPRLQADVLVLLRMLDTAMSQCVDTDAASSALCIYGAGNVSEETSEAQHSGFVLVMMLQAQHCAYMGQMFWNGRSRMRLPCLIFISCNNHTSLP